MTIVLPHLNISIGKVSYWVFNKARHIEICTKLTVDPPMFTWFFQDLCKQINKMLASLALFYPDFYAVDNVDMCREIIDRLK